MPKIEAACRDWSSSKIRHCAALTNRLVDAGRLGDRRLDALSVRDHQWPQINVNLVLFLYTILDDFEVQLAHARQHGLRRVRVDFNSSHIQSHAPLNADDRFVNKYLDS